ncbi:LysE family translocator [Pseudomonas vanderleydeniana]|uniref:LysE family translocator n=1 Tax=Pseudomonas vanderleydeniana TaxID=2745495 RepID=A0A9E6PFY3_9PSED|nr:LysE family transporter [Pseudomonas vanderleydeniana]QXI26107.1 LysE family translocator [Pseudomonas vanderleydeniana]
MQFTSGFFLSLSLCLDIGLANIAMITLAMQRGFLQGFWLGLGTCFGDLIYAILALVGMTVLLQFTWVKWTLWIGGSALLIYFAIRMIINAWQNHASIQGSEQASKRSGGKEFLRGIFMAVSSPSAILWFAAVGGTLISRSGAGGLGNASLFLAGFFVAGVCWCVGVCTAASHGGKLLGDRMLKYSYIASAVIFAGFAVYVIGTGYQEFILGQPVA